MLIIAQAQQIACYPKEGDDAEQMLIGILKNLLKDFAAGKDSAWRETLRVFPQAMAVGGERLITSDTGWDMATSDPWCAFYALQHNYDKFAEHLEEVVMRDGGATYHLMQWTIHKRVKRHLRLNRYYKTLITDPYWAWRALQQNEGPDFLERLKRFIRTNMYMDPAAAFLWIVLSDGRDDDDHWSMAMTQANTLYYLSYLPKFQKYKDKVNDVLRLNPKWACHLLLAPGLDGVNSNRWKKVLIKEPEWVAEYIARTPNISMDEINALAMDCRKTCTPSYVLERFRTFKGRYHEAQSSS